MEGISSKYTVPCMKDVWHIFNSKVWDCLCLPTKLWNANFYIQGCDILNLILILVIPVKFQRNYNERQPYSTIIFNVAILILLSVNFKHAEQILVVEDLTETRLRSLLNIINIQLFNPIWTVWNSLMKFTGILYIFHSPKAFLCLKSLFVRA